MPWNPALTKLRDALADLYPSEAAARRVADEARLAPGRIAFGPTATNTWHALLEEAEKQGQVAAVLEVALGAYPSHAALLAAREAWGGAPAPKPTRKPRPGRRTEKVPQPQEATMPSTPLTLFYSYAHKDEALRDELDKALKLLQREGVISAWHDRDIDAGDEWKREISTHLQEAQIILLLVSRDFVASDYCWDVEMKSAMKRHEKGEARVIPVIVRPCDWKTAPFGKLQALPKDGKAVISWPIPDEAWTDIAQGIRRVAKALRRP